MNLLALLVPGVGMGGGEEVVVLAPRVTYRPTAPAPPSAYRPLSSPLPSLYRPTNPTTPAG